VRMELIIACHQRRRSRRLSSNLAIRPPVTLRLRLTATVHTNRHRIAENLLRRSPQFSAVDECRSFIQGGRLSAPAAMIR
jgi:hypothetical protein